jgi:hypothetical protein
LSPVENDDERGDGPPVPALAALFLLNPEEIFFSHIWLIDGLPFNLIAVRTVLDSSISCV